MKSPIEIEAYLAGVRAGAMYGYTTAVADMVEATTRGVVGGDLSSSVADKASVVGQMAVALSRAQLDENLAKAKS
jgi:hypothetical protein